jgi:hypothetical protein
MSLDVGVGARSRGPPSLAPMNLARHVGVLWRFRTVTAAGVSFGIFLAVLGSYKVMVHSGMPSLEPRSTATYSSKSSVLVTQPGFPEGRVVLPTAPVLGSTTEKPKVDPTRLEFADPNRFMVLADLYTKLIVSDQVRRRIPGRPAASHISASPLAAVSGTPILPIIELTVKADTPANARALNGATVSALRDLLEERQAKNGISPAQRVEISTLNAPSGGVLAAGPSHTTSILALLLCVIGTVALTHLLASLRPIPGAAEPIAANEADGIVLPWGKDDERAEPQPEHAAHKRTAIAGPLRTR